jgi:hypothetical protein
VAFSNSLQPECSTPAYSEDTKIISTTAPAITPVRACPPDGITDILLIIRLFSSSASRHFVHGNQSWFLPLFKVLLAYPGLFRTAPCASAYRA